MNTNPRTAAALTAASLRAARGGVPVMIPGALEMRTPRRVGSVVAAVVRGPIDAVPDRGQLEYARGGGGAPTERGKGERFARLRHWLFGSSF